MTHELVMDPWYEKRRGGRRELIKSLDKENDILQVWELVKIYEEVSPYVEVLALNILLEISPQEVWGKESETTSWGWWSRCLWDLGSLGFKE